MKLSNKTKGILIIMILYTIFIIIFSGYAKATIDIIEPTNDNPIINTDFDVIVYINETTVKSCQVRVIGQSWQNMEQTTNTDWSYRYPISNFEDGELSLTAKYLRTGETTWNYVSQATKITIKKPVPPKGQIEFHISDKNNNGIPDVSISGYSNKSDSSGYVKIGNLNLNTPINFTFTKDGYKTVSHIVIFPNNTLIIFPFQMVKIGSDLRTLEVTGYNKDYVEAGQLFYLRIRDKETGESVNGAMVMLMQGQVVKAIPGNSTNGGRHTITFSDSGIFEMVITKDGYNEWSEFIQVYPSKITPTPTVTQTPTPTPSPTPIPTPPWRTDAAQFLTDDQYRDWLAAQERLLIKETPAIVNFQNATTTPNNEDNFPYTRLLGGGLILGVIGYKVYQYKKNRPPITKNPITEDILTAYPQQNNEMLVFRCKEGLCDWTMEFPKNLDITPELQKQIDTKSTHSIHEKE